MHQPRRTRSRRGCGNCRLRRVKCDEGKPCCLKCIKLGLVCDYARGIMAFSSSYEHRTLHTTGVSTNQVILNNVNMAASLYSQKDTSGGSSYELSMANLQQLSRFLNRTLAASYPPDVASVYQRKIMQISVESKHVMHSIVTLTAMHDRYLADQTYQKCTPEELFHWSESLRLLNQDLEECSTGFNCDAVWVTAALVSWATLFAIETNNFNEVWPLKPTEPSDLTWLEMQKGLKTLWQLLDYQKSTLFHEFRICDPNTRCLGFSLTGASVDNIIQPLRLLCGIDESSNASNNPYYTASLMLSLLLRDSQRAVSTLRFLAFPNTMEPEFEALLRRMDPRALQMLSVWYSLAEKSFWWISGRAAIERKAIRTYLKIHHSQEPGICMPPGR